MCYLAREHQAPLEDEAAATSTHTPSVRPRWVGAAVAAVMGGFALAAFLAPSVPPASADEAASVGPQPVAANLPAAPVADRGSPISPDDGVPTSTDVAKSADSSCHHGL